MVLNFRWATIVSLLLFVSTSIMYAQHEKAKLLTAFKTVFENNENETATYRETIMYYKKLATQFKQVQVSAFGPTDSGFPLHEVIISKEGNFDPMSLKESGKVVLLINNAIHPGEPCGVDASMMLARDLLMSPAKKALLEKAVIVIIPIYNIGGSLNRGSFSRANQNGPSSYGFRGNGQNLDLNRDFIKGDTENSRTFQRLFTKWNPDILIDNHTSNGADYQYVISVIPTQKDKMEPILSTYVQDSMLPELFKSMSDSNYEMTPYVYANGTPDSGIIGFLDLPRYSTGYANLFNCIGFMPETHMLKPFKDRVWSTYHFMISVLQFVRNHTDEIKDYRTKAIENTKQKSTYALQWRLNKSMVDSLTFKGYEARYKPSLVSGLDRLYYDHATPFEKRIPYYNTYKTTQTINKPFAYIVPQAYKQIVDRMKENGVEVVELKKDEMMEVEIYTIEDFTTTEGPYEGHYLHSNVDVSTSIEQLTYRAGDYVIYTNQEANNYIVHTLEPQAPDSWFAWNYFDGILMQKEHFSSYVFEDLAAEYLQQHPELRYALEKEKREHPELAQSAYAQLKFVYERSPYFEPTYRRYPVGRRLK